MEWNGQEVFFGGAGLQRVERAWPGRERALGGGGGKGAQRQRLGSWRGSGRESRLGTEEPDGQRRLMGEEMGSPAGSQRSNVTKNGTESSGIVMGVSDG